MMGSVVHGGLFMICGRERGEGKRVNVQGLPLCLHP